MDFALSQHDPWPNHTGNPILFVLDANNAFEHELLLQWLAAYKRENDHGEIQVQLNLDEGQGSIDCDLLEAALFSDAKSGLLDKNQIIAPLRIAWLPKKSESDGVKWLDLLRGNPRRPRQSRARGIARDNPERVACIVGEPDNLSNLMTRFTATHHLEASKHASEFAAFVGRQAGLVLDIAERCLQGGRYKVPRYVADNLKANPQLTESIANLAQQENKSLESLSTELGEYIKEMVSVPSRFYIDVNAKFNNFVLGLGYEPKIVTNPDDLARMLAYVRGNPSMLLWTHKTYLDGMVVPKILYDNDFPLPHMFGGANLSFAGLGFLLRRSGAIFIRRSFQNNPLYKLLLRHYIGYLMEKRFPMTWSFEGTRSRLGKLMPPRYGLLKYVLEACHTTEAKNIHIIPIAISYDLIRDVDEYATEQTGRAKGAESLRWFIGYVSSLRKPMGRIYVDIGEPVVLPSAPEPGDRLTLSKIAFQVAVEANKVTPITLPSLVCMSLLGNAPQALTTEEALVEVRGLLDWALQRGIRISSDFDPKNSSHVAQVLDIMIDEGMLTRYDEGPEVVFGIAPDQHPRASYYRNSTIHFFVNKAIIELSLLATLTAEKDRRVESFWDEAERLRDLFKFEFFYAPSEEFKQELLQELTRYDPQWESMLGQSNNIIAFLSSLRPLVAHATLLPFIESYTVVADMLARLAANESLEQKVSVDRALKYGRQAYLQRRISSEASIGKILFQNAYQQFKHQGLTESGGAELASRRKFAAKGLHELSHRLDRIRVLAIATRDIQIAKKHQLT